MANTTGDIRTVDEILGDEVQLALKAGRTYITLSFSCVEKLTKQWKDKLQEVWELQELNEHLKDQQKKVRMFVDSKGEVHPLEPEPVEPKEEENSNNLHGSFWTCGKCGQAITVSKGFVRYCWNCGTPVKWD